MTESFQHAEKKLLPDPILVAVGNAFYGDVRPLEAKISAIWLTGIFYLEELEKNRSSDIKKVFKQLKIPYKDITTARDEILKINFSRNVIFYNENIFIRSYIGIIYSMQRIKEKFYQTTNPATRYPDLFSEVFREQLIKGFINENIKFINNVISDFFILLLCCQEAGIIHATRIGVSLDKSKLISRAKVANKAGIEKRFMYGEYVLRKEIEILIASKSRDEYKSLNDFYNKNFEDLRRILEEYKDKIGFPVETGGPTIEYGENLEIEDLYDKINNWKNNPRYHDFNELLKSIISENASRK